MLLVLLADVATHLSVVALLHAIALHHHNVADAGWRLVVYAFYFLHLFALGEQFLLQVVVLLLVCLRFTGRQRSLAGT